MRPLNKAIGEASVAVATAATVLPFPPTSFGLVSDWNLDNPGVVPEFDLEIWANLSVNLTAAELFGAVLHPLVSADDDFTATHGTETFTAVAHGLLTGDGPFRLTNAGGALPAGLATLTDYWIIKVDDDNFQLATSLLLALAGTEVLISGNGTGTHTISDVADSTKRVHWHSYGLLGPASDGAITLTAQRAYVTRCKHRPRTFAYAVGATLSAETPETVSCAVTPIRGN